MFQFRAVSVIACGLVFAVAAAQGPVTVAPALPDAKVYAALLEKALAGSHGKVVLLQDTAGLGMEHLRFAYVFPGPGGDSPACPSWSPKGGSPITMKAWKEASDSFRLRNLHSSVLPPLRRMELVSIASKSEVHQAFVSDGWHSFYKWFPGTTGLLSVSEPGYSSDGRVALVCFSIARGPRSAEQDLVVLELGAKGWKVTKAVVISMA